MKPLIPLTVLALALCTLTAVGQTTPAWSGEIGLTAVGISDSGNAGSFRSQTNLEDGFVLDALKLAWKGDADSRRSLLVEASGFGGAEPTERARIVYQPEAPLRLSLDYDRRSSFFALGGTDLGLRRDDWDLTTWRGRLDWDGWSAARLVLDLRHVERSGTAIRPFFGLNEIYPVRLDLDETMDEAAVRLETRNLPVHLTLEQSWATYERDNRYSPYGDGSSYNGDPDILDEISNTRNDEITVPTTNVTASYRGDRFEFVGAALYSPAELDFDDLTHTSFAIGGGNIGHLDFIENVAGAANRDTIAGNVRFGFLLGNDFVIRLTGEYHDTATDGALLGENIVRATNPAGGTFDFTGPRAGDSIFDTTDTTVEAELEWSHGDWTIWGGGFTASREVSWNLEEDERLAVDRDSDGILAGVAWRGKHLSVDAEYKRGTFERFVFRTDPETTDRLSLTLRADVGNGWTVSAKAYSEDSDNPTDVASLNHDLGGESLGVAWSSADGTNGLGLEAALTDMTTETGLVLPTGEAGDSLYDLSLMTATLWGRTEIGNSRLSGSVTRVDDDGDTWPLTSWHARALFSVPTPGNTEVAFFGEHWQYDEKRAEIDDFEVTRYGITFTWRFE